MKNTLSGLAWVALYLAFCLVPLVLAAGQHRPPGRPFLVELAVALGFVGLSMLVLQFALVIIMGILLLLASLLFALAQT